MTRLPFMISREYIRHPTRQFSIRFFDVCRPIGLVAAAEEARFGSANNHSESLEYLSVLTQDPGTLAAGPSRHQPIAVFSSNFSPAWANLSRSFCSSSPKIFTTKTAGLKGLHCPSELERQNRCVHSACMPICTLEDSVVHESGESFTSHKLHGEKLKLEQSGETCVNGIRAAVCEQPFDGTELKFVPPTNFRIGRSFRKRPALVQIHLKLDFYSKVANLHGALELFDEVKHDPCIQLDTHCYNQLLYLCSGAASGKLLQRLKLKKNVPKAINRDDENAGKDSKNHGDRSYSKVWVHFSPEDVELAIAKGADILEAMLENGVEPDEATYTSIVRLAVAKSDCYLAFEMLKLMQTRGILPKLRSCGPLLLFFCENKETLEAYEFENHMRSLGIEPDESMLDCLLKLSTEAGRQDKVYEFLHRLRKCYRVLLPTTVQSIENWFLSDTSAIAGKARWNSLPSYEEVSSASKSCGGGWHGLGWLGTGAWQVRRTTISRTGLCLTCGERLCTIDLDTKETENFAIKVAKCAQRSESIPSQFSIFQDWIDEHGPFDAVIDGANAGLYNPKVYRGFNSSLLQAVVDTVNARFCVHKPPLVVLHARHKPVVAQFLKRATPSINHRKPYAVYFTPPGTNDDWYWLYAAVKCKCLILSNDQMRDHIFALLGNDFFPKWKERHQVQFSFTVQSLEIYPPPPYSTAIQESEKGSWHVPEALPDGDDIINSCRQWLCATRSNLQNRPSNQGLIHGEKDS